MGDSMRTSKRPTRAERSILAKLESAASAIWGECERARGLRTFYFYRGKIAYQAYFTHRRQLNAIDATFVVVNAELSQMMSEKTMCTFVENVDGELRRQRHESIVLGGFGVARDSVRRPFYSVLIPHGSALSEREIQRSLKEKTQYLDEVMPLLVAATITAMPLTPEQIALYFASAQGSVQ